MNNNMNNNNITINISNEKKILDEKRKRHQIYTALDYFFSGVTYLDFFSVDAFDLLKKAQYLAKSSNQVLTSEFLLASYFLEDSRSCYKLLEEEFPTLNLKESFVPLFFSKERFKNQNEFPFLKFFKKFFKKEKPFNLDDLIYSRELEILLEKAAETALKKFKTPVVTSEILFITIMDDKVNKAGKFIKRLFKTEIDWYLFRYKIVKLIHLQESILRSDVSKNQQYFAYLLKIHLPEFEFNRLLEKKELQKGVLIFRNLLISEMLKLDIFEYLTYETKVSLKNNKKRKYSL
jgi:hypothetical protein